MSLDGADGVVDRTHPEDRQLHHEDRQLHHGELQLRHEDRQLHQLRPRAHQRHHEDLRVLGLGLDVAFRVARLSVQGDRHACQHHHGDARAPADDCALASQLPALVRLRTIEHPQSQGVPGASDRA